MKFYTALLNTFLLITLGGAVAGCKTTEERKHDKEATTIRFHLEVSRDGTTHNGMVPVYRAAPVYINVEAEPFLDEGDVAAAAVVDTVGGFAIEIRFNQHGTFVLSNTSTAAKGARIAISAQFGQSRWLAAPAISKPIIDGRLSFTPDATREEAERIVRGLNNVAKKVQDEKSSF